MPGLKPHNRIASAIVCLLAVAAAQAGDTQPQEPERDSQTPPEAFLLFLGEWQDEQGNWQDPMDFDGPGWQVLDERAEQRNETD